MLSKEQLLTINGLTLSKIINEMDNNQIDEYCKALFAFCENFPALSANLKNCFNSKDYDAFSKALIGLRDLLGNIHAIGFVQSCNRLHDELSSQNFKMSDAHLTYLTEEISNMLRAILILRQKNESVLNKEQLLAIKGLRLSGIVNDMDNNRLEEYCNILFAFIENFPLQETKLKSLFNAKDYDAFSTQLSSLRGMLEKIYATGLAQSCLRLSDELGTQNYKIVEAHMAYLLVEISEFSIDIQMTRQKGQTIYDADAKAAFINKSKVYSDDRVQKIILAVDDVSLTLNSLKIALKDTKYKLIGVNSGADALKFLNDHYPDLFILDIEMPVMNGYELAQEIRNRGHKAPIIFLTGNSKQEYVVKAIKAGAADFIVKPVNNEHVLEKIKKFIGK